MYSPATRTGAGFVRLWRQVDAKDQVLGRLATLIAHNLMGKHKPIFDPRIDVGDYVVVTNARHVQVTGKKEDQKTYYSHSQYPGALKATPYKQLMDQNPTMILRKAVSGMLPKNKLRDRRLERLHIFPDEEHPYHGNLYKDYTRIPVTQDQTEPQPPTQPSHSNQS
ncbi:54S ribosomal protein L23, mitochondrial [Puccinia graminis f. sp. tritici]|uniref:54S ribosomal protein L23, mitochondrial n=1 Tax=Puccinia graminis f. sp. tritici TaxID=56615 RepID=A0A5B0MZB6_PUCGR|nr:54S ribosomal protein L23, mitochondrial [Puccinia graminis f. sp. tritici]KAA1126660.1 54S ribosomal protein L23, mitochondrial [Puccinia graminis f. sp. tritici]KAA1131352.1 54S ribosomal protein L23, mitochondrial [Puccinia graminis f. sp. tritici]